MQKLTATYRIITPMFISGADQNEAELRVPSIKGALRFWYRAIDPDFRDHEAKIFGGSGDSDGQALFLLRVQHDLKSERWNRDIDCFNELNPKYNNKHPNHSSKNKLTWQLNGIRYLGYPFFFRDNKNRKAILPGGTFNVELIFKKPLKKADQKRIIASLWLLGHFGALGSRARRGFGVIQLESLSARDESLWPELNTLPIALSCNSIKDWRNTFESAFQILQQWFPENRTVDHTVFSNNTRICLVNTRQNEQCQNRQGWEYALDTAGKLLQAFRQRWNLKDQNSDYYRVKRHLCQRDRRAAQQQPSISPQYLGRDDAPRRAAFGLPLTFRYSSLAYEYIDKKGRRKTKTPNITFEGSGSQRSRSASRIWIRIALINNNAYPVFIRLDAPLLKEGDQIKHENTGRFLLNPPNDDLLNQFWESLKRQCEIIWRQL